MTMTPRSTFELLGVLLLAWGCGDPSHPRRGAVDAPCESDASCVSGLVCRDGVCATPLVFPDGGQSDLPGPSRPDRYPAPQDEASAPDTSPSPCKLSETHHEGHCYLTLPGPLTYGDAVQGCVAHGMKIVAIESAQENEHVFEALPPGAQSAWIGLIRASVGSTTFFWDIAYGGVAPTYLNWAAGQPDNATGNENCVVMGGLSARRPADQAKWTDVSCVSPARDAAVCERLP
jgi:hypothetical protein